MYEHSMGNESARRIRLNSTPCQTMGEDALSVHRCCMSKQCGPRRLRPLDNVVVRRAVHQPIRRAPLGVRPKVGSVVPRLANHPVWSLKKNPPFTSKHDSSSD